MNAPSKRAGSLARWLAGHLRCSADEAEARLLASQRAAFRLTATDVELRADAEHAAADERTGVRVDATDDVEPSRGISMEHAWELLVGPGLPFGEVVRRDVSR